MQLPPNPTARTHKKKHTEVSCYQMALDRLEWVYDRFDAVAVSFSRGKDSTACLNLTVEVAKAKNRLPVQVIFFDEEAIPPETVAYMERVAVRPEVQLFWYCVPLQHRNACSSSSPYWHPWAPEDEAKWVRPLPPRAITSYDGFTRKGIADQIAALFPADCRGMLASVMGIRCQESLSRHSAIAAKSGFEAFLSPGPAPANMNAYPIYDWFT